MQQFHDLYNHILNNGVIKGDRTGTGTISVFGYQTRFDLNKGFPLVTGKKVNFRPIKEELLWFLRGETNANTLNAKIWDEWSTEDGELGPIYGQQWRSWSTPNLTTLQAKLDEALNTLGRRPHEPVDINTTETRQILHEACEEIDTTVDQIQEVISTIQKDPNSRRMVVSAWNPADLPISGVKPHAQPELGRMALAPCHCLFQFYVAEIPLSRRWKNATDNQRAIARGNLSLNGNDDDSDHLAHCTLDDAGVPRKELSCQLYQRSSDCFIGVPFNIASYSLLTHIIARICGLGVGEFIWTSGDTHIYTNHIDQVKEYLSRTPTKLPTLRLEGEFTDIDSIKSEQIKIEGYNPHPAIKADISV